MARPVKYAEFRVRLKVPEGATVDDVRDYIEDAVACWKGSRCPDDPIFDLDGDSVRVRRIYRTEAVKAHERRKAKT